MIRFRHWLWVLWVWVSLQFTQPVSEPGQPRRPPMPRKQQPMNEAEINTLRNLIGRIREEDPNQFLLIVYDSMLNRMDDETVVAIRHKDQNEHPDACLVICKGREPAVWAEASVLELQRRLEEYRSQHGEHPGEN